MDLLKAQLNRIQQQLGVLSASQKMLTGLLAVIMVATLVWWARYAADPEMEPVLNQSLNPDDIAQITNHLQSRDIHYKIVGDKVLVPVDRKMEVLADLGYSQMLPRDIKTGFDDIVKQSSPWDSPDKTEQLFLEAKQKTLGMVIRDFPGVATAVVLIDPNSERRFDNTSIEPSAMVNITTRAGHSSPKQLANAAADVIAGAQAGLSRGRINVVIDGSSYPIASRGENGAMDSDRAELNHQWEVQYQDKIRSQFNFINGLMVSVTVQLSHATDTHVTTFDQKNSIHAEAAVHEYTADGLTPVNEAGSTPNTSVALPNAVPASATSTVNDSSTNYINLPAQKDQVIHEGSGDAVPIAASIRVPRSYFINSYKLANPATGEPDSQAVQQWTDAEIQRIRSDVKACTGIKDDAAVTVNPYSDVMQATTASLPTAAVDSPVTQLLGAHSKEIGIGALAMLSLFMAMLMVKKDSTVPVATTSAGSVKKPAANGSSSNPAMDAMESDDESGQMIGQVRQLVAQNPDAAADVIGQWLKGA